MVSNANFSNAKSTSEDNEYFTATIVGLPSEVVLGRAFTARSLKSDKTITVQALTAETWLSQPARQLLQKQVKKPLKSLGLPFPAANFSKAPSKSAFLRGFMIGFGLCATLSAVYITQPSLQQLLQFK